MNWYQTLMLYYEQDVLKALRAANDAVDWETFLDTVQFTSVDNFTVTLMIRQRYAVDLLTESICRSMERAFYARYALRTLFRIQIIP